jgi:hypothetical protein
MGCGGGSDVSDSIPATSTGAVAISEDAPAFIGCHSGVSAGISCRLSEAPFRPGSTVAAIEEDLETGNCDGRWRRR